MKNQDIDLKFTKFSIIISIISIVLCLFFIVYEWFITKTNDITIWLILGLCNLSIMFANLSKYKKNK